MGRPEFLTDGTSHVVLDPEANTVSAGINIKHQDGVFLPTTTRFDLGFAGTGDDAYVDDEIFLALGEDGSSSVIRSKYVWKRFGWIRLPVKQTTEYGQVTHTGALASVPNAPLCEQCEFLKYGFWASDVTYGPHTDKMGGWWVATSEAPISSNDMPLTGTARYEGLAVGTLAQRQGDIWTQQAGVTGDMGMDWYFAQRAGWLQIDNFGTSPNNSKSFGGPMFAPGRVEFFGPIAGSGGIGAARGSFVGSAGPQTIPKGVMGDFGIAGSNWRANGIFGGGHVGPASFGVPGIAEHAN